MVHKSKQWLIGYLITFLAIGITIPIFAASPEELIEKVHSKLASIL